MSEKKDDLVFLERTEMVFKIIVIGDPAVGKTSLLTNFCGDKFSYEYIPTVGVNITKEPVTIKDDMGNDLRVNLMVWDIAGQCN
jgi:small GTP-binding protein